MKKMCLPIKAIFFLNLFLFYSCSSEKNDIDKIYTKREYILKEFKGKSVVIRGNLYQLSYFSGQSVNLFYFEKKADTLILINDSLNYPTSEIEAFSTLSSENYSVYKNALCSELLRLLKIMHDFNITNISSEFASSGVDLKIYLRKNQVLLYVSDPNSINNNRWENYIKSGKKLDENWYNLTDK